MDVEFYPAKDLDVKAQRAKWKLMPYGVIVGCPDCGRVSNLSNHSVDRNGAVSPSMICMFGGCNFHHGITLRGWVGDNIRRIEWELIWYWDDTDGKRLSRKMELPSGWYPGLIRKLAYVNRAPHDSGFEIFHIEMYGQKASKLAWKESFPSVMV